MVVIPVVPEGAASNRVDNNKEDEENDISYGNLLPVMLEVGENPCLARLAVIAKSGLATLPCVAVRHIR